MDWHWVDVIKRFGKENALFRRDGFLPYRNIVEAFQSQGWTGYSWNTELFPDYKELLSWLHDKNFKVTVNLHPAQGVRPFEDQYEDFARFMGVDPKSKNVFLLILPTRNSLMPISTFSTDPMKKTA